MYKKAKNIFLTGLLSVVLVFSAGAGIVVPTVNAYADDLSDAQSALDAASSQLDSITSEYNQIQSNIAALDAQMSETTTKVMEAQSAMLKGQDVLGEAVKASYKNEGSSSLVNVFLMSDNLSDFLKNITYYASIQEDQAELVEDQKALRDQFQSALGELESQKEQQDAMMSQAAAKKAEAEKVVSDASAKVSSIESERARLAELQAKAAKLAEEKKQQEAATAPGWNTNGGDNNANNSSNSSSSNNSSNSSSNNSNTGSNTGGNTNGSSSNNIGAGWKTGVASAYGGSSDPWTPNPGTTATGAVCNDTSMGVAIPMSWPNYWQYFGHAVEISYGGRSVIATINDCGGMGGGSRSLDLQPGVFKALGYSTCQAWGVRTVSYRIL